MSHGVVQERRSSERSGLDQVTQERMALIELVELVEKQAGGEFVREMLAFAVERIMEAEVEARTGAAKGARAPMREVQRNRYRDRDRVDEVVSRML